MNSGCIQKSFFGCSAVFLFFFVIIILFLISSELPQIDFTTSEMEKREYSIEFDSLSNEAVVSSSFALQFVDNSLKRRKYNISFKLLEKDVKEAIEYIEKLAAMSYRELGLEKR